MGYATLMTRRVQAAWSRPRTSLGLSAFLLSCIRSRPTYLSLARAHSNVDNNATLNLISFSKREWPSDQVKSNHIEGAKIGHACSRPVSSSSIQNVNGRNRIHTTENWKIANQVSSDEISRSSTSNLSVALGGMSARNPRSP